MLPWCQQTYHRRSRHHALLVGGIILATAGAIGTLLFLYVMQQGRVIPPRQLAMRLILPHITLLTGIGMILSAILLIRKQRIMDERQNDS